MGSKVHAFAGTTKMSHYQNLSFVTIPSSRTIAAWSRSLVYSQSVSRLRRPKVRWLASSSGTRSRKAKWGRKGDRRIHSGRTVLLPGSLIRSPVGLSLSALKICDRSGIRSSEKRYRYSQMCLISKNSAVRLDYFWEWKLRSQNDSSR